MGNRLISFLTTTLPQHSQYTSSHQELMEARDEVKLMLVEAGRLLGEVALWIDRLEWDRYQNTAEDEDGGALRRRRNLGVANHRGDEDEVHLEDDEEGSDGTNSESCSDDEEEVSELESILEEANEDEDETDSDVDAQDDRQKRLNEEEEEEWEADFSSTANAFDFDDPTTCTVPVPSSPTSPITNNHNDTTASPTKPIASILQTPTATPTPKPPRKKNRHRRVKFSPDVKPGKHHPQPPPPAIQHGSDLAGDDNVGDEDYEDYEDYHHAHDDEQDDQDDLDDERNLSLSIEEEEHRTFLQMTQMEFVDGGSFDDGDANDEDVGEDEDDAIDAGDNALAVPVDGDTAGREERTRRRRKAWEIVRARSGTGNDTGNGDREEMDPIDDGDLDDDDEDEDNDDASIDDDAVLAAATNGIPLSPVHSPSRPTRRHDTVDQVDQALFDLTKATEALSVRVRRFETEEVDDVPTDEEHTDDEGAANDVDDEFATAPGINDLSRSSILYESDNDNNETRDDDHGDGSTEGQGHDIEDPEDLKRYRSNQDSASEGSSSPISERLSFMHAVAIQNFYSDFHRSMAVEDDGDEIMAQRRLHEDHDDDHDSDAADSWAQDGGDGDDDDDFDTTSASENGDGRHDFGGDGFLQSELGFDGPLPAFPSDGRDPFFLDKEAPWPDRVEEFDPFDVDSSLAKDGMEMNWARARIYQYGCVVEAELGVIWCFGAPKVSWKWQDCVMDPIGTGQKRQLIGNLPVENSRLI